MRNIALSEVFKNENVKIKGQLKKLSLQYLKNITNKGNKS